jgi:hypothetical protein
MCFEICAQGSYVCAIVFGFTHSQTASHKLVSMSFWQHVIHPVALNYSIDSYDAPHYLE